MLFKLEDGLEMVGCSMVGLVGEFEVSQDAELSDTRDMLGI